jgi:hypothetical protein
MEMRTLAVWLALASIGCAASPAPVSTLPTEAVSAVPVPIYRETLEAASHTRFFFSTRTEAEAHEFGWHQLGIAFYAFITPVPGTVPVYCETPASAPHSDYRFSTEPEAAAHEDGWMRLNLAFYAYPEPRAGTIPIAMETPLGAPEGPFGLGIRGDAEARSYGWERGALAFYALPPDALASAREKR